MVHRGRRCRDVRVMDSMKTEMIDGVEVHQENMILLFLALITNRALYMQI